MNATALPRIDSRRVPLVEAVGMTKRFGELLALDDVSLRVEPGSFHAILGENGAGKSTLVKCIMGYHRPDAGHILIDCVPHAIHNPRQALDRGLGLVYQHFTLVPNMTAAENVVLGMTHLPPVIDWNAERAKIQNFQRGLPLSVDLDARVVSLGAGQKQKLEILKQLYLGRRLLILDEPTSVLTPSEAGQVLGLLRDMSRQGLLSVVLITHKFGEALEFAQDITVLRGGKVAGRGTVSELRESELASMMFGRGAVFASATRQDVPLRTTKLEVRKLTALNDRGVVACRDISFSVRSGEILGIAGVVGNGQRELVEVLAGQRTAEAGEVLVAGSRYCFSRREMQRRGIFLLTEEPLNNSCVRSMSVADNLSFRNFDEKSKTILGFLVNRNALKRAAARLVERYHIRTPGLDARIDTLSGGNVQRTVLARELSGAVSVLIAQNPCVGLDFAATKEIRAQIMAARNGGAAILLMSEDLDELLELSDRIAVMFEGQLVYETLRESADVQTLGLHMASGKAAQRTT